jgi:MinD superfamily P-loop ATPase
MVISIASGKGGTGKTTVATNLALSIAGTQYPAPVQFLDCDVEEPNAHIFLKPQIAESRSVGLPVPQVDFDKCTYCGKCSEVCQFSAIAVIKKNVLTFPELCHGCGACSLLCPVDAITEVDRRIGVLEIGQSDGIRFIHGVLEISEAMSPPLIRAVKEAAYKSGTTEAAGVRPGTRVGASRDVAIVDVPPGTSCPVIEAVKGSDFCLLVTEPTPFGLNDLVLAVEMLRILEIPFGVAVNRSDVGDDGVDNYCHEENIPILMKIPMDRDLAVAYSRGAPLVAVKPEWKARFLKLFDDIKRML